MNIIVFTVGHILSSYAYGVYAVYAVYPVYAVYAVYPVYSILLDSEKPVTFTTRSH